MPENHIILLILIFLKISKKCNVGDISNDKNETSLYHTSGAGANWTYNSYDPKDVK